MTKLPKFSIIIPVYNVENYLSECLYSVIHQNMIDIEIICVNDGTRDNSRRILEEYQKADDRIQIIDKPNGGLSSARNCGMKAASGEYLLFLDSDDYLNQNSCERLYYEVLETRPDIIVFGSHIFPYYPWPDQWLIKNLTTRTIMYRKDSMNALLHENGASPFVWRNCYRREFLAANQLSFNENVRFGEDIIFQFCSFPMANHIVFISDKLYHYRWSRPNSLMANASKNLYKKYLQHINAMQIIAEFWRNHDLLPKYSEDFLAWSVSFIGWDIHSYDGPEKADLIHRTNLFWKTYNLINCSKKLSLKDKMYFYYIRNYS